MAKSSNGWKKSATNNTRRNDAKNEHGLVRGRSIFDQSLNEYPTNGAIVDGMSELLQEISLELLR